MVEADSSFGAPNDVFCGGFEPKLGTHGSPSCTMIYGDGLVKDREPGAVGWLVAELNRGLAAMFTMMNNARLAVGIRGVAIAEAATQNALAYAPRAPSGQGDRVCQRGHGADRHHPDVKRNLLTMTALTRVARSVCYSLAHAMDMARFSGGDAGPSLAGTRQPAHPNRQGILNEYRCGRQFYRRAGTRRHGLHRGNGCCEPLSRCPHRTPIYEGTNGIQATDLVTRKLPQAGGQHVLGYIAEWRGKRRPRARPRRQDLPRCSNPGIG